MKNWLRVIKQDLTKLPDFLDYYDQEYQAAKLEVRLLNSGSLEKASASLPQIAEHRFCQLQDIEGVLEYLNIQYRRTRSEVFQKYFENQKLARALTSKDCDRYVDGDLEVNTIAELVNDVAATRNMYLAILKGVDNKSFQINNIVKLRAAGLSDAEI